MEILICGLREVPEVRELYPNITKVLSIIEFEPPVELFEGLEHRTILVGDHEWEQDATSPTASTVEQIIEFADSCADDDVVLVHCWAGVSRSTAAAMIIHYRKHSDLAAAEACVAQRRIAAPNRLIAELADRYFEHKDNELLKIAQRLNDERGFGELTGWKL